MRLSTKYLEQLETKKLFGEFPPISTQSWEETIIQDLKGADYEKKLIWNTGEGFQVKPYYRSEDVEGKLTSSALPGESPYLRGSKPDHNRWEIRQDIEIQTIEDANKKALEALQKGATALAFNLKSKINSKDDLKKLLQDIYFECIQLNLSNEGDYLPLVEYLLQLAKENGIDPARLSGSLRFDPLIDATLSGGFEVDLEQSINQIAQLIELTKTSNNFRVFSVNGNNFREAGAGIVQELAFSLSVAVEYIHRLTEMGKSIDEIAPNIQFNFATGTNYFLELAKIRSFRYLWAHVVDSYQPKNEESKKATVHCYTTQWDKTLYDPYVNLLRGTTEAMSAVLGGTDSLSVSAFDEIYRVPGALSTRVALNVQHILKEEAFLDQVADPAAGSYYIENLTYSLIEEAWKLFLKIEEMGGYNQALMKGWIQSEIENTCKIKLSLVSSRRETLLGSNQYPNFTEQMISQIDSTVYENDWNKATVQTFKPLKKMRASIEIESLRLATEKSGKRPKVFMLTIGNLAMRLARSQFSSNFFSVAGFEVIDNNGFNTIDEGVKAALAQKADIVVLCSSDEEYETLAIEAMNQTQGKMILVVAGNPPSMEMLKSKGIKNFISVKSNLLETLRGFQKDLNII